MLHVLLLLRNGEEQKWIKKITDLAFTLITKINILLPVKGTAAKGAARVSVDFQVKFAMKVMFWVFLLVKIFVIEGLEKVCNFSQFSWVFFAYFIPL